MAAPAQPHTKCISEFSLSTLTNDLSTREHPHCQYSSEMDSGISPRFPLTASFNPTDTHPVWAGGFHFSFTLTLTIVWALKTTSQPSYRLSIPQQRVLCLAFTLLLWPPASSHVTIALDFHFFCPLGSNPALAACWRGLQTLLHPEP